MVEGYDTSSECAQNGVDSRPDILALYSVSDFSACANARVVWKGTQELGCALVVCPGGSILDAHYGVRFITGLCLPQESTYLICVSGKGVG